MGQTDLTPGKQMGNGATPAEAKDAITGLRGTVEGMRSVIWSVALDESNISVSSQTPGHPAVNLLSTDMTSFWESADLPPPAVQARPTIGSRVRIVASAGYKPSQCGVISTDVHDSQPFKVTFDGTSSEDGHWFHEREVEALIAPSSAAHTITIALPPAARCWEVCNLRVYLRGEDSLHFPQRLAVTATRADGKLDKLEPEIVVHPPTKGRGKATAGRNECAPAQVLSPTALAIAEAKARAAEAELLAMLDLEEAEAMRPTQRTKNGGKANGGVVKDAEDKKATNQDKAEGRASKVLHPVATGWWLDVLGANMLGVGVAKIKIDFLGAGARVRVGKIELKLQSSCLRDHVFKQIEEPGSTAQVVSCANGFPLHVLCTDFGGMARPWIAKAVLLRAWRKYVANPVVHSRLQNIRERQAAQHREAGMLAEEEAISADDFEVIRSLLVERKFSEADKFVMQALRQNAVRKRDAEVKRKSEEHHAALHVVLAASETLKVASKFRWTEAQTLEYANLRILLDRTVGLDSVKEWILQRLCDCAERAVCEDAFDRRHVLLAGGFGVGKRTATLLLVRAMKLLWSMSAPETAVPAATPNPASNGTLDDFATVLTPQEGQSVFNGIDIKPTTIYYVRIGAGFAQPKEMVDGRALRALTDAGSVVIISGESVHIDKFLVLEQMCREEPYRIDLSPLSLSSLARITLDLVRRRDLRLCPSIAADRMDGVGTNATSPDDTLLSALEYIVRQTYGAAKMVQHGGYLASEMLQVRCLRLRRFASSEPISAMCRCICGMIAASD
jgi:hypothetical protein